jgi:hypothetical protein
MSSVCPDERHRGEAVAGLPGLTSTIREEGHLRVFLAHFRASRPGEKLVLVLFCLTCLQAAVLTPDVVFVPGERAKVFTGLLCGLSLITAILFLEKKQSYGSRWEILVSACLLVLCLLSSLSSSTPQSSLFRGFVVIASGLGGFWCARLLLNEPGRQVAFIWLCIAILVGLIGLGFAGYATSGEIDRFVDVNPHPVTNRMLVLSFAPLALVLKHGSFNIALGVTLLCLGYGVFLVSNLRSVVLTPIALAGVAVAYGNLSLRRFLLLLIPVAVVAVWFFAQLPAAKFDPQCEPSYYRVENYPFSWHIAVQNPLLGIGLRAPRDKYLENYQIRYPYVTKEKFAESCNHIVSSENIFLTFMVELGFPFLIIYVGALIVLFVRLGKAVIHPDGSSVIPPLALMLPLIGALLHFQVLDGLLHPQISWFFHLLLGLIPRPSEATGTVPEKVNE